MNTTGFDPATGPQVSEAGGHDERRQQPGSLQVGGTGSLAPKMEAQRQQHAGSKSRYQDGR